MDQEDEIEEVPRDDLAAAGSPFEGGGRRVVRSLRFAAAGDSQMPFGGAMNLASMFMTALGARNRVPPPAPEVVVSLWGKQLYELQLAIRALILAKRFARMCFFSILITLFIGYLMLLKYSRKVGL